MTETKNTLNDCNLFCKTNGCNLFQWNQNKHDCKLFNQAILNEHEIFYKEANSVIGIPDCNDEKVIWLKRPFGIPTTTTITTTTPTTRPTTETTETDKTQNEDDEPAKYIFTNTKMS
jgi:hypothetical protein